MRYFTVRMTLQVVWWLAIVAVGVGAGFYYDSLLHGWSAFWAAFTASFFIAAAVGE